MVTIKRPEKSIQGSTIGWARKKMGLRCDKLSSGSRFQSNGLLDYIIWIPGGKPLIIEFKIDGGKMTALQQATFDELKALGYDVYVVDNVELGKKIILDTIQSRLKERKKK